MKRLFVWMIGVLLCYTGATAQKTYLLSVGVSDYPGTANDLRLPVKDASAVKWLYEKNSNAQTVLLADRQATRSNILSQMQQLFSKASAKDIVILHFSGHGCPGYFCAYDELLSYKDVQKVFAKSKAKNKIIFADACHAGQMRKDTQGTSTSSVASSMNVMLFLAARDNEYALELSTMTKGLFTSALLRGLRGAADKNRDRTITAKELFDYVSPTVIRLSEGKQHPVMWGNFNSTMPVMVWPKKK